MASATSSRAAFVVSAAAVGGLALGLWVQDYLKAARLERMEARIEREVAAARAARAAAGSPLEAPAASPP